MADQDSQYDVGDLYSGGGCEEALHVLYEYLDGELTVERRGAIQRHLHECSPCLHAFDFQAELKAVVARSCRDQVPEGLRVKVAEAIAVAARHEGFDGGHSGQGKVEPGST